MKRKHRQQMTPEEIERIESLVHAQTRWSGLGPHKTKMVQERQVPDKELFDVLNTGRVVEVNHTNDLCVVFRKDYEKYTVCVVANLPTRWIITAWKNKVGDKHRSLDISQYCWKANLIDEFKEF